MKNPKSLAAVAAALLLTAFAAIYSLPAQAATLLPPAEGCYQATTGITGMVGALGVITGGSGGTAGIYGGVALAGGSGTGATANITVAGGVVTGVAILNPGIGYQFNDLLSAAAANIGNTNGFSIVVNSVAINSSLAGGSVGFYIPNTLTPSNTWTTSTQSVLNANPVALDQNGCAIVYGEGIYRQIVKDSLGNTVWDQLTASTDLTNYSWAGTATGAPNAITLTDAQFTYGDGQQIGFIAASNNTTATTIKVGTGSVVALTKGTTSGQTSLTGNELVTGVQYEATYSITSGTFQLVSYPVTLPVFPPYYSCGVPLNAGLTATVSGNALTITLVGANGSPVSTTNPVTMCFRSTPVTVGNPTWVTVTSPTLLTVTIPSSATLGTSNTVPARLWVFAEYNGGTPEIAVATCSKATIIFPCKSWQYSLPTTVSVSAGATSAGVPYSTTGVVGDSLGVLGYVEATEATAGTWVTAPSLIQVLGYGTPLPGDVVQEVSLSTTAVGTSTSFSFAVLTTNPISLAISPSSAINLLRIQMSGNANSNSTSALSFLQIYRGTTPEGNAQGVETYGTTGSSGVPILLYDSPGTTSSTTYNLYAKTSAGTLSYPFTGGGSFLEIEEIMGALEPVNDNLKYRSVG